MTISIPTKTNSSILAYHHEQDGVKGYILQVGPSQAFLPEADADNLGRYFLFQEPAPEVDVEDTQPHDREISEAQTTTE